MGKEENTTNQHFFLHEIFKGLFLLRMFNPFPNKPWFLRVCRTSLLKTLWEKEKLLVRSNFSFSHSVFYLFWGLSAIFIKFKIVVCQLFQFGRVWNMSSGKWLKKNIVAVEKLPSLCIV